MKSDSVGKEKVVYMITIMAAVTFVVASVAIGTLYFVSFEQQQKRLLETAQSQARLIEAIARFDSKYSGLDNPEGVFGATLSQIIDAHENYEGFDKTGEFTLAELIGDEIIFLLSHRHDGAIENLQGNTKILMKGKYAEPMQRALSGESGVFIGLDYRGEKVLAAFEPIVWPGKNIGIVAKIDMSEVRAPFIKASWITCLCAIVVMVIGAMVFRSVTRPLLERIKEITDEFGSKKDVDHNKILNITESREYTSPWLILSCIAIAASILAADIYLPLGVAAGVPYVALVLASLWSPKKHFTVIMAIVGTVLTMVGFFVSPPGSVMWIVLVNRFLALFAIWIVAILSLHRKNIEEEHEMLLLDLSNANEELVKIQKLESIGVLAGGIAHDFNNYLQGILSNIGIAKGDTDPNDKIYENLTEAEEAVRQAKDLTQQLLTFSKGGDPVRKTFLLPELLRASAKLVLSGSDVRCEFGIPDDLWSVEADKGQIYQVISNLFINADHAMPEGGNIRVWAENINVVEKDSLPLNEGRYVKITIKDHGAGISHENMQKIFDPYFTTGQEGSGLGLSISYSIIKKHDGYITVESEIGDGTSFHIYLPASDEEIREKPAQEGAEEVRSESVKGKDEDAKSITIKGRVLLMDDEGLIRLAIAQHIKNVKYEVETAKDGTEAIELYRKAMESGIPFGAVILDLTIPGGMGGAETIKKLLEIDPDVAAIVSSGYSDDPIMADFSKYGFSGVLAKPYEMYELDEILQNVMRKKES